MNISSANTCTFEVYINTLNVIIGKVFYLMLVSKVGKIVQHFEFWMRGAMYDYCNGNINTYYRDMYNKVPIDDLSTYIQFVRMCNDSRKCDSLTYKTTSGRWLLGLETDATWPDKLYQYSKIYFNLNAGDIITIIKNVNWVTQGFRGSDDTMWSKIHESDCLPGKPLYNADKPQCKCNITKEHVLSVLEQCLLEEHNDKIGAIWKVWWANYNNAECMTTWLPNEVVNDVMALLGGAPDYNTYLSEIV